MSQNISLEEQQILLRPISNFYKLEQIKTVPSGYLKPFFNFDRETMLKIPNFCYINHISSYHMMQMIQWKSDNPLEDTLEDQAINGMIFTSFE